jgi:hypothetical protein
MLGLRAKSGPLIIDSSQEPPEQNDKDEKGLDSAEDCPPVPAKKGAQKAKALLNAAVRGVKRSKVQVAQPSVSKSVAAAASSSGAEYVRNPKIVTRNSPPEQYIMGQLGDTKARRAHDLPSVSLPPPRWVYAPIANVLSDPCIGWGYRFQTTTTTTLRAWIIIAAQMFFQPTGM